ncbi:hypothetical protein [Massilia rhizosphaerae]|uniref:hypothetical protein n=1 Tax=Massilia rhizosphaerae TaxID=2784389 RepID=UPI0018DB0D1E|nr:hypothetical protein [Massilia rhizosphaerae]
MTPAEFVTHWRIEKDELLDLFMGTGSEALVSQKISSMGLSEQQTVVLRDVLNLVLTETFYTLLLGLDGVASIGGVQHSYRVLDEDGDLLCGDGRVETEAYAQLHADG